jgi:hypothetical protein
MILVAFPARNRGGMGLSSRGDFHGLLVMAFYAVRIGQDGFRFAWLGLNGTPPGQEEDEPCQGQEKDNAYGYLLLHLLLHFNSSSIRPT